MDTAKQFIGKFEKDNISDEREDKLIGCILFGAMQFGPNHKQKIKDWIKNTTDLLTKEEDFEVFGKAYHNFEAQRVFKDGKIYADFENEETSGIEFIMLIGVGRGWFQRTKE